jgi:hypothetical protein
LGQVNPVVTLSVKANDLGLTLYNFIMQQLNTPFHDIAFIFAPRDQERQVLEVLGKLRIMRKP